MKNDINYRQNEHERYNVAPFSFAQQMQSIEIRDSIKNSKNIPQYLLAIEVNQFLQLVENKTHLMLFQTLWNTGALINEALKLTPDDFNFSSQKNNVKLLNSRYRNSDITNEDSTPQSLYRIIPLTDQTYITNIKNYLANSKLKQNERIWNITERTAQRWADSYVKIAEKSNIRFSIQITPQTFRHSYAMHLLYAGLREVMVQKLLGHSNRDTVQIYMSIIAMSPIQHNIKFLF